MTTRPDLAKRLRQQWRDLLDDSCAGMNAGCNETEQMDSAVEAAAERIETLEARLSAATQSPDLAERLDRISPFLVVLANWIDTKYPEDENPQMQRDLRGWSDDLRAAADRLRRRREGTGRERDQ